MNFTAQKKIDVEDAFVVVYKKGGRGSDPEADAVLDEMWQRVVTVDPPPAAPDAPAAAAVPAVAPAKLNRDQRNAVNLRLIADAIGYDDISMLSGIPMGNRNGMLDAMKDWSAADVAGTAAAWAALDPPDVLRTNAIKRDGIALYSGWFQQHNALEVMFESYAGTEKTYTDTLSATKEAFIAQVAAHSVPVEFAMFLQTVLFLTPVQQVGMVNCIMRNGMAGAVQHWNALHGRMHGHEYWVMHGPALLSMPVPLFADYCVTDTIGRSRLQTANALIFTAVEPSTLVAGGDGRRRNPSITTIAKAAFRPGRATDVVGGSHLTVVNAEGAPTGMYADLTQYEEGQKVFNGQAVAEVQGLTSTVQNIAGQLRGLQQSVQRLNKDKAVKPAPRGAPRGAPRSGAWIPADVWHRMTPAERIAAKKQNYGGADGADFRGPDDE